MIILLTMQNSQAKLLNHAFHRDYISVADVLCTRGTSHGCD
jgi:hypothetical protein